MQKISTNQPTRFTDGLLYIDYFHFSHRQKQNVPLLPLSSQEKQIKRKQESICNKKYINSAQSEFIYSMLISPNGMHQWHQCLCLVSPAKAIEMPFASTTLVGPGKHLLHSGPLQANTVLCSFNTLQDTGYIQPFSFCCFCCWQLNHRLLLQSLERQFDDSADFVDLSAANLDST